MKIESSTGTNPSTIVPAQIRKQASPAAETDAAAVELTSQPRPESTPQDADAQRGVIRNLLEGHYKGVADVRLRINFYAEISAVQEQARSTALTENTDTFKSAVESAFTALLADESVTEEQTTALNALKTAFGQSSEKALATNSAGVLEGWQQNISNLLDSVKALFATAPEETAATDTLPLDPGEVIPEPNAYDAFEAKILAALSGLQSAVENVNVLPELSPPSGQGAAYEKFLQIYKEMQGASEPPVDSSVDNAVVA